MSSPPASDRPFVIDKQTKAITLGIGALVIKRGPVVIRTLVGSCIALAIYDRTVSTGGLAHIVHPRSPISQSSPESPTMLGKYADTAIAEMVRQIIQMGGDSRRLSAKFAGGSAMFAHARHESVGTQNLAQVIELLNHANIPILGQDCGGKHGRRVAFDVSTGRMTVEAVGRPIIEF